MGIIAYTAPAIDQIISLLLGFAEIYAENGQREIAEKCISSVYDLTDIMNTGQSFE